VIYVHLVKRPAGNAVPDLQFHAKSVGAEIGDWTVFACVTNIWKLIMRCSCRLAVQFSMINSFVPLTSHCFGCVFILIIISIIVLFIIVINCLLLFLLLICDWERPKK